MSRRLMALGLAFVLVATVIFCDFSGRKTNRSLNIYQNPAVSAEEKADNIPADEARNDFLPGESRLAVEPAEQSHFPATENLPLKTSTLSKSPSVISEIKEATNPPKETVFEMVEQSRLSSGGTFSLAVESIVVSQPAKNVRATVSITSRVNFSNAIIYAIIYDRSGMMVSHRYSIEDISEGSTQYSYNIPYTVPAAGHNVTFVMWDLDMHPLCESVSRSFTYGNIATSISVRVSRPTINMALSETATVSCTVEPASLGVAGVKYYSSNENIARVSATGVITPVSMGRVIITGVTADEAASDITTIYIYSGATAVHLNQSTVNMWTGGAYNLKATPTPATTTTPSFASSDTSVCTVTAGGTVRGLKKGSAKITVKCDQGIAYCTVNVFSESDYIGSIAEKYESSGDPGAISHDSYDSAYGLFQFSASSNVPKAFYQWLISSGRNASIGNTLQSAHNADGGYNYYFGANFDAAWKKLAQQQYSEFYSCQMEYTKTVYYDPLVSAVKSATGFDASTRSLGLKAAFFSRAVQHGVTGAKNRIVYALSTLPSGKNETDKKIIAAIYAECGRAVSSPPDPDSIPMNSSSSIAVQYGLVGKYMKYYSLNSSDIQASVWRRLNVYEPEDLYHLVDYPPVVITPQT